MEPRALSGSFTTRARRENERAKHYRSDHRGSLRSYVAMVCPADASILSPRLVSSLPRG
jgi:hypothetical protein